MGKQRMGKVYKHSLVINLVTPTCIQKYTQNLCAYAMYTCICKAHYNGTIAKK